MSSSIVQEWIEGFSSALRRVLSDEFELVSGRPLRLSFIYPVYFGIVGDMALGFRLITPPYGQCLKIASKIGGLALLKSMGPKTVYLTGMLGVLLATIVFPEIALGLPRRIAPDLIGVR